MKTVVTENTEQSIILAMTIRDLTDRFPQTMSVLAAKGLDLCCGGGHQLGEALRIHEIDQESTIVEIMALIGSSQSGS